MNSRGRRASSREEEAAQPRVALALLGWAPVRLQYGRAPALLRGPIWHSCWHEDALLWASLAQTCLADRLPAQEGAGCTRLGDAAGAFLASPPLLPCLCTLAPGVLGEGLGAGGLHTAKGSSSESSVRRKGRAPAGLLQRLLGRPDSAPHGEHQAPRAMVGFCSPENPEADPVGAQQVHDRRRFPSTLLPSTDMCRWFGPDPACLGTRPQPQLSGNSS